MVESRAHNPEDLGSSPSVGTKNGVDMKYGLSDKLMELARLYAHAQGVKEAARLRIQCDREEWELVQGQAKHIRARGGSRFSRK